MKKLLALALFVAACGPAAPAVHTPDNEAPHAPAEASVRTVDWKNRPYDLGDEGTYTPVNGEVEIYYDEDGNVVGPGYVPKDPDAYNPNGWFSVSDATYGDVTGDGVEEALVVTAFNGGGTGIFDDIRVFAMKGGKPVEIGVIPGGDRGDGGLSDFSLEGTTVLVNRMESQDGDGACCPSKIQHERWSWSGGQFVEDESARQLEDMPQE